MGISLQQLAERLWPPTAQQLKCDDCGGTAEMRVVDSDPEKGTDSWVRVCLNPKCGKGDPSCN